MACTNKKLLYEVSIIRPFVIFLLVVLHSFTMYGKHWNFPEGIHDVNIYFWFSHIISGFRIETIALIAGYVFAYQSLDLKRKYKFTDFAVKKFKRLIIPGAIFSFIYFFCFEFDSQKLCEPYFYIDILIRGTGHLWFLPMLFYCFLIIWIIDHYKLVSKYTFIVLALLSAASTMEVTYGLTHTLHYSFYCYFGYTLYMHRDMLCKYSKKSYICMLLILYLTLVFAFDWAERFGNTYLLMNTIKLIMASSGITALFLIVFRYTGKPEFKPKAWVIESSRLCYGVYILHQFILTYLYYYTNIPAQLGSYLLPWVGCAATLMLSTILTRMMLKTRTGRYLIG